MIVVHEASELPIEASLIEDDHVVQTLAPNSADHSFDIGARPGPARRRQNLRDSHRPVTRSWAASASATLKCVLPAPGEPKHMPMIRRRPDSLIDGIQCSAGT